MLLIAELACVAISDEWLSSIMTSGVAASLRRHLVPQGRGRRVAVVPYPVVVADGVWRATSVVAFWPH